MRELDLLHHIYKATAASERVTIPPGDDMGSVRIGGQDVLVTVDQVADGVHFLIDETPIEKIARKAITRNLSDVAAMAAKPVGAVASVALFEELRQTFATELFEQMRKLADKYECPLFGGDITIWKNPLHMSVTLLAEPDGIEPVLRSGAQPGDVIFVSGRLGGSLEDVGGYVHHLDFEPRIALARKLAGDADTRPRCMLDLSDGLASDLPRLCRMGESKTGNGLSAIVDIDQLPVSDGAKQASSKSGKPAWLHAMIDGEDYELCFMLPADRARDMPARIAGVPITRVGEIVEPEAGDAMVQLRRGDGTIEPMGEGIGWEHRSGD